jgi:hypothetical protein
MEMIGFCVRQWPGDMMYKSFSAMSKDTGMCHKMDASGSSYSH